MSFLMLFCFVFLVKLILEMFADVLIASKASRMIKVLILQSGKDYVQGVNLC